MERSRPLALGFVALNKACVSFDLRVICDPDGTKSPEVMISGEPV